MGKFFTALKRGVQAASEKSRGTTSPPAQRARLGYGTLILMALIVWLLLARASEISDEISDLKREIRGLQAQVERLQTKIDSLSTAVPPMGKAP